MNLNDLINIVEVNKRFNSVAPNSFWNKYKNNWTHEMDEVNHAKMLHFGNFLTYLKVRGLKSESGGIKMHQIVSYLKFSHKKGVNSFEK